MRQLTNNSHICGSIYCGRGVVNGDNYIYLVLSLSVAGSKNDAFLCCIVDEASQCTEPEALTPLIAFRIEKLVLIGDTQQLPATIISRVSRLHPN